MTTFTRFTTAAVASAGLVAAASLGTASADGPVSPRSALHADATIVDATGTEIGIARFTEDATGRVHVDVKASGLEPGEHGIHLHAVGACTPSFAAAGGHHNPLAMPHGSHAGDLPNLVVNGAGNGRLNAGTTSATLSAGPTSLFDADGSAIVIHADPDDFVSQPTGNSGGRVGCGVIVTGGG